MGWPHLSQTPGADHCLAVGHCRIQCVVLSATGSVDAHDVDHGRGRDRRAASATLGASIAADVIDLDASRSREARAGLLLAYWGIAQKGADAIGVGLGLSILSFFAFDPNGANDDTALFGLKVVYILVPMLFWLLSAIFIWGFPLTPERQRRIRSVLERRAACELAKA